MARARSAPALPKLRTDPVPWNPGEHVAIIGTTGTGKSYLVSRIVDLRRFVAVFQAKPDDIKYKNFRVTSNLKAMQSLKVTDTEGRFLIRPDVSDPLRAMDVQARVAAGLFLDVWKSGNWTLVIDELFYTYQILGLKRYVDMLMTQGRSKRISMVVGMQRPVHVTRFAISEASHILAFRLEGRDNKIVDDVAGEEFAYVASRVPRFHFAHYHVPTRSVAVGTADRLERVLQVPPKP